VGQAVGRKVDDIACRSRRWRRNCLITQAFL